MNSTHDHVDRAVRSLLRILGGCDPEQQPQPAVLETLVRLLELHHQHFPGSNIDERMAAMDARVNRLENQGGLAAIAAKVKMR